MQFHRHAYDKASVDKIENGKATKKEWIDLYQRISKVHGPYCPEGTKISAAAAATEQLDEKTCMHLRCTKPGAFIGVMEFPEDFLRKFAAALVYNIQHEAEYCPEGPEQCGIRNTDRWSAHALDPAITGYLDDLPKPANATPRNSHYLYSDTVAYYDEYAAKDIITWQEAYALYFELIGLEPLEENIPTWVGEDARLILASYLWTKRNRPTYRLWPEWTHTFSQSRMVEFPTNLYVQPYTSIAIILPITDTPTLNYRGKPVHSIGLTTFNNDSFHGTAFKEHHLADNEHMIHLYATTTKENGDDPADNYTEIHPEIQCTIPLNTDLSLIEQLDKYNLPPDYKEIWSVALSVAYLGTCQYKLIEPDILSKDIAKYLKALKQKDLSKISQLHAKATKRRHHLSYNIGRNTDSILRILGETSTTSKSNGEPKRELNFRHIRRFHFRHINQGKGAPKERVIPMMEMIIRPDKPDKEWYDINFRSLDDEGK